MRKTFLALTTLLASLIAPALADPVLYPDGSVRYSIAMRSIPTVAVQSGDLCDIVLQPGEHINQAFISDSIRWKMTDGSSGADTPHIFVKPTSDGLHALLTVTTSRRTYHIRLVSSKGEGREFIGFYYPVPLSERHANQLLTAIPQQRTALEWTCARPLDSRYRIDGSKDFRPLSVCNDGSHTYVNMGHIDGTLPVLVTVGDRNDDQIIGNPTYMPTHNEFIIDGVPERLALLRDSRHGQIRVNIVRSAR